MNDEERFWSKVEKSDGCWQWVGCTQPNGYGQFRRNGRARSAHRTAFELANGFIDPSQDVDHICFNRGCVNPAHLRQVTRKQNLEHRRGAQTNSRSGIRGVSWHKRAKKWMAEVQHHGKSHYLGLFTDLKEAEEAAAAKRQELFTHDDYEKAAS